MRNDDPRNRDREDVVLSVVQEVLNDDGVDLEDNFFSAGGDSMRSLQVVEGLSRRGFSLQVVDVLTADSLRHLAGHVRETPGSPAPRAEPDGRSSGLLLPPGATSIRPASQLQVGMLFLTEMAGEGTGIYLDFCGVRVAGALQYAALEKALAAVVERHEALRSFFDLGTQAVPAQVVLPHATVVPECATAASDDEATAVVRRWREEVVDEGIDTEQAPPLRCHVVVQPRHFRLSLATHHSMLDGWSFNRLLVDLLTEYDAALAGRAVALPAVPTSGDDFVRLERDAMSSPATQRYWRRHNQHFPVLGQMGELARASRQLVEPMSDDSWARLRRAAARFQVPLKSLCLAAHARAVGAWRDETEVVTGVVTNGRPEVDGADQLVGLFLNTVPVRLPVGRTWPDLAQAALDAEREMYPHRRYPLATMLAEHGGPVFDVTFNFTHFHLVRELEQLHSVSVDGWWDEDIATFPMMVDVFAEDPMRGTGTMVTFDPDQVEQSEAQDLSDRFQAALHEAAALVDDLSGGGRD